MVTGALFHVKHRYDEAYEALRVPLPSHSFRDARVSAAEVLGLLDAPDARPVLFAHPSGKAAWIVQAAAGPVLVDAATGEPIPQASSDVAVEWARAAVAHSAHAHRYGEVVGQEEAAATSLLGGGRHPALVVHFEGGKRVTVDRLTGELTQTGALNDFIDWTYRVHYLQWTPWKGVNVALVIVAVPLVLSLALSGLWMTRRRGVARAGPGG